MSDKTICGALNSCLDSGVYKIWLGPHLRAVEVKHVRFKEHSFHSSEWYTAEDEGYLDSEEYNELPQSDEEDQDIGSAQDTEIEQSHEDATDESLTYILSQLSTHGESEGNEEGEDAQQRYPSR